VTASPSLSAEKFAKSILLTLVCAPTVKH
jgi:hypothetical protein